MASDIKELYEKFLQCTSVSIDSRKVAGKGMFFALKGNNLDGNEYASDALSNGCSYVVIDNPKFKDGDQYILVDNVLKVLQELGKMHRKQLSIPVVGITGSNGKTTTKEYVAKVLGKKYKVQFTIGNLNNHIGVPLTLLSLKSDTEIAVIEMGANHIGEIAFLCSLAEPNYGVITNIGKAHLEGFGSIEGVIKAKGELYDYLKENRGLIVFNKDSSLLNDLVGTAKHFSYGASGNADVNGELLAQSPNLVLQFQSSPQSPNILCYSQIMGKHNFENIMAAIGLGVQFKVADEEIKAAIESYVPQNNRSQVIQTKRNHIILDAYNANPMNMRASIDNFALLEGANKLVILGDMLELGQYSVQEHEEILQLLTQHGFSKVILVGDNFSKVKGHLSCLHFNNASEVAIWLDENPIEGSLVLLKGSRGIGLEILTQKL